MSEYEIDSQRISEISFDKSLTQKEKNAKCSRIEAKMSRFEQLEINGKNTGYYN